MYVSFRNQITYFYKKNIYVINCPEETCAQLTYYSLTDLVYSKDQSDEKFTTIESYNNDEHIVKIGDHDDDNKLNADATIYSILAAHGWPKVASAFCVPVYERITDLDGTTWRLNEEIWQAINC